MKSYRNNSIGTVFVALLVVFSVGLMLGFVGNDNKIIAENFYNPESVANDTISVNSSNTLNLNNISNFAKWNISAVNATTQAETLAMVTATDYYNDGRRYLKRYTGQIIINSKSADTVFVGFPGTGFVKIVNETLILNPAFHDSIFYYSSSAANVDFQILYTIVRLVN